jgi:hypothetical protein
LVIKDTRRVPKRLRTGDKPAVEAVKVKVGSDDDNDKEEEEESLDNDNNEEQKDKGQEEQVGQPVAHVERPQYVPLRPKNILMEYNKSMGDGVIPNNKKVLRPKNHWCYTILDPVFWGENSIDRCPTYGVCWVCCSSRPTGRYCQMCENKDGPTGRYCQMCENKDVIYICMSIILKKDRGEEITRMVDTQWISCIFDATHIDPRVNRVQETHLIDQWGYTPMEWLKNRVIKKYHDMRTRGIMIGTDDEIKPKAIEMVRLIQRGLLEKEKNGESGVCWTDKLTDVQRGDVTT